jgi:DNA repair exonuclease SbcCD ATPase subunit
MSGDALHAVAGVDARARDLSDRAARLSALRGRLSEEVSRTEQEITTLSVRIEKLGKVSELFRLLLDLMVEKEVRGVENVVTDALQTIFYDRHLSFEAEVSTKYNRPSVEFFLRQGAKDNPLSHRGSPLEAFGGGPATVASLLLRIMTALRMKLFPLLILDETLAAISDGYIENTGKFLHNLAEKMGFDILLVTHKTAFLEHVEHVFRVEGVENEDGTSRLTIRSLK